MRILILGGTRFLGRHLVAAAQARGHQLTLFHRGAGGDVETIQGDRYRDLDRLRGRRWDAVIDTSGYLPRSVRAAAEVLADAVEQYVFISSVSVYADLHAPRVDEHAPVATLSAEQVEQANAVDTSGSMSASTFGPMYGGLKALCEVAAEEVLPRRVLSIRAGLIVGAHDYTDRFTYWVARVARGGEVLVPGEPQRHVQFIDAHDLARWLIDMVEARRSGVFNANGPPDAVTMNALLETCRAESGSDARFTWVDDAFLLGEGVKPWTDLPLWLPHGTRRGLMATNVSKAMAAGLRRRPLRETVRDVLQDVDRPLRAGLTAEHEIALLQKWRERA
jgi:2'-hydroxyisoflavone reductase